MDMRLGASVYATIIENRIIKGQNLQPVALSSKLGWLLTGNVATEQSKNQSPEPLVLHCACDGERESQLLELVQDFWRAEEIINEKSCSPDEQSCEEYYANTTPQDSSGRSIVKHPWKNSENLYSSQLEKSYTPALRALHRLQANFAKDEKLNISYTEFMKQYIDLDHMSPAPNVDSQTNPSSCFLPHHGVWKETSTTTKLRTVFNGSCKTPSGVS